MALRSQRLFFSASVLGIALWSSFLPVNAIASEEEAAVFSTDLDLSLIYIDSVSRPSSSAAIGVDDGNALHVPAGSKEERGLGLRRAKAAFTYESPFSSKLYVLLRPDATQSHSDSGDVARELDTRAGVTYRKSPDIRLLDAYQITVRPGTGMSLGFGVWEQLSVPMLAYEPILQPGLDVFLPVKFSGMRLRWNKFEPLAQNALETRQRGIITDFYVIQGDRDRVETNVGNNQTDDHAPGSEDPHYGGALSLNWIPSNNWSLLFSAGSLASETTIGKGNEVFGELNGILRLHGLLQGLTSSLHIKQSKESFKGDSGPIEDRLNQSIALQFSLGLVPGTSLLTGFSFGKGAWPTDETKPTTNSDVSGYQIEIGFQSNPGNNLVLETLLAQERRIITDASGKDSGGYISDTGTRNSIRRLALQVSYLLSGAH